MKFATHYNRVERRTFVFSEMDILIALQDKAIATLLTRKPAGATGEKWTMEIDLLDGDEYQPKATLTQTFEYPPTTEPT